MIVLSQLVLLSATVIAVESPFRVSLHLPNREIAAADAMVVRIDVTNSNHLETDLTVPVIAGHNAIIEVAYENGEPEHLLNRLQRKLATAKMPLRPNGVYSVFGLVWNNREGFAVFSEKGSYQLRCRVRHDRQWIVSEWVALDVKPRDLESWRFLRSEKAIEVSERFLNGSLASLTRNCDDPREQMERLEKIDRLCGNSSIGEIIRRKRLASTLTKSLIASNPPDWSDWQAAVSSDDDNLREWLLRHIGVEALRVTPDIALPLLENVLGEMHHEDDKFLTLQSNFTAMKRRAVVK